MAKKKTEKESLPKGEYFECVKCTARWQLNTSGCPNCGSSDFVKK